MCVESKSISKLRLRGALIASIVSLELARAFGQGTMIFDQRSSTDDRLGEQGFAIGSNQPIGQSFTPSLEAVRFISLSLSRGSFNQGATIFLNLRSDSITGAVMAATSPVSLPIGFIGVVDFFFPSDVAVVPGTKYFFQPMIQSGGPFDVTGDAFLYPGGSAFLNGDPVGEDLWFREGIIVPEPSMSALLLVGAGIVVYMRGRQNGSF